MRPIKLRAWRKKTKQWIPLLNLSGINDYFNEEYLSLVCAYPDSFVVVQFTGLKDKNGKEIYEEDIVSFETTEGRMTAIVKWVNDLSAYYLMYEKGKPDLLHSIGNDVLEVIGNIYESPDPLKKGK